MVGTPLPLIKGRGKDLPKIESLGGGYQKFCYKEGITLKRGVATFLLLYSSIAFTVCRELCVGRKSKVSFITF